MAIAGVDYILRMEGFEMKKYVVMVMVMAMTVVAYGHPLIQEGVRELIISGGWDPKGVTGQEVDLEIGYGVFVTDAIELGGTVSYASVEDAGTTLTGGVLQSYDDQTWEFTGLLDYHFDIRFEIATMTVPYVGLRVGYVQYEAATDEDAIVYGPRVGVKHFVTDSIAVDVGLSYMFATEDIFVNEGTAEDTDISIDFGIRVLF